MATVLSIIIPLAPGEQAWRTLMPTLQPQTMHQNVEILLLSAHHADIELLTKTFSNHDNIRVIEGTPGRAPLMNLGTQQANSDYLWFLHSDNLLPDDFMQSLLDCIKKNRKAIYYFDLHFLDDGPSAMKFTSKGVYFRSSILHLPFGDQAFLMPRDVFKLLGGYDETLLCGEDHLLVWQAHLQNIPVLPIGNTVFTSARKYQQQGWLTTSLRHVVLTVQQALPPFWQLLKNRLRNKPAS